LLEVENLSKEYPTPAGPLRIVSDVSLSLPAGAAVSIMGPSGSGKSTLLYMLGALEPPSSGTVTLKGQNPFLLGAKQLAAFLQVSESTVRRLAAKRRIPSVRLTPRIIRFHLDAVREALDVPRYRIRHGEYTEQVDDAQLSFDEFFLSS